MNRIVAFPDPPSRPGQPERDIATLPPTRCQPWCLDGTGHADAVHIVEQRCVGVLQRIDTINGGNTGEADAYLSFATITARAQQIPGQPPTFLVGIDIGDIQATIEMNAAELGMFIEHARTLLRLTSAQAEPLLA